MHPHTHAQLEYSIYCPQCNHTYRKGRNGPKTAQWFMEMHRERLGHDPRVTAQRPVLTTVGGPR